VWDALLLEGSKVVLRVALAIFSRYENTICSSSYPAQLRKVRGPAWRPACGPAACSLRLVPLCLAGPACAAALPRAAAPRTRAACRARAPPPASPAPQPLCNPPAQVLDARLSRAFDADALLAVAFKGVGSMPNSSIQALRQQALQEIHEQQLEQQRRLEAVLGCKTQ
jgi:hypothetical protein